MSLPPSDLDAVSIEEQNDRLDEIALANDARRHLLLAAWLKRKLPPRDYLLGNIFCTTSRWLIFGDTGVGKTLFALSMAGAMASANSFLTWDRQRCARVMYLDGEMLAETFKERMQLVAEEFGEDHLLFGYSRDVLGPDEMGRLNTPQGEKWLWREIGVVKPDAIVFDSIMCLLAGTMTEEESWTPVKQLMRKISSNRVGQVWLHHTGHDSSRGFGTKTREWEMDTVLSLTATPDEQGVLAEFKKARLRTPQTADQFKSRVIVRNQDGWTSTGEAPKAARTRNAKAVLSAAILAAYDRLADGAPTTSGFDGKPVRKVPIDRLRDELKGRGFLETNEAGAIISRARFAFHNAKAELISLGRLIEKEGEVWR